jgi:hypothetical protein
VFPRGREFAFFHALLSKLYANTMRAPSFSAPCRRRRQLTLMTPADVDRFTQWPCSTRAGGCGPSWTTTSSALRMWARSECRGSRRPRRHGSSRRAPSLCAAQRSRKIRCVREAFARRSDGIEWMTGVCRSRWMLQPDLGYRPLLMCPRE